MVKEQSQNSSVSRKWWLIAAEHLTRASRRHIKQRVSDQLLNYECKIMLVRTKL